MGTSFSLGIIAETSEKAHFWLNKGVSEIQRIEKLLSEYQGSSITSMINNTSKNIEIKLNAEVFHLIQRSKNISTLTQGCFDITAGSLKNIYNFKTEGNPFPSKLQIENTLKTVGYNKLKLNQNSFSITKTEDDVQISFNAIGKGYAADRVKKLWMDNGISSGYINASGDLCSFGTKLDLTPWNIAIAHPEKINKPLFNLQLTNQAIATSGDAEQYFIHQGTKYSHNINPLTGIPLSGLKSVSVISPSAELSDALATAVYVMGKKDGIQFINQLPQTHGIIIDNSNSIFLSKNLNYEEINL
jgi:thiamine biosynthesis lipoprotein